MSFQTNLLGARVKIGESTPWVKANERGTIRAICHDSDGIWCVVQLDFDQRFWNFDLCNLIAIR